jgi:HSP20 family protein
MPGLILWKNQEINRLRRDMDRLLTRLWDDFGVPFFPSSGREVPSMELSETGDTLMIKAQVPGINPEDIEISISEDILTIKGKMKRERVEEGKDYRRVESGYSSFSRNLRLPCKIKIDDVRATYQEGELRLILPKCTPEKARDIKVQVK